jgi:hypothetical protein
MAQRVDFVADQFIEGRRTVDSASAGDADGLLLPAESDIL